MGTKHFLLIGTVCLLVFFVPSQNLFAKEWIYTTSKGDTLWDFSKKYLHHVMYWPKIKKINNVKNPRRLQPNQKLRIPLKWVKVNPVSASEINDILADSKQNRINMLAPNISLPKQI